MAKTIFDYEEIQIVLQNFNEGMANFETIIDIDFSKVCTKTKRINNRMRNYLEEKKVNIVAALGNGIVKGV